MQQMKAPQAPVAGRIEYRDVKGGFMRHGREGEIFFIASHGSCSMHFPVLEDRSIFNDGELRMLFPMAVVEIINPGDLGFSPGDPIRWVKPADIRQ